MKMPAATTAGGVCFAMPDVCKVPAPPAPPVPTPFPNIGTLNGCESTVAKVLIQKKETVTEASKMPSSKGDEAGTLGGMVSNANMPAGAHVAPSQVKVLVAV